MEIGEHGHRTQYVQSPVEVGSRQEHVFVTILLPQVVGTIALEATHNNKVVLHLLVVCLSKFCYCIIIHIALHKKNN